MNQKNKTRPLKWVRLLGLNEWVFIIKNYTEVSKNTTDAGGFKLSEIRK